MTLGATFVQTYPPNQHSTYNGGVGLTGLGNGGVAPGAVAPASSTNAPGLSGPRAHPLFLNFRGYGPNRNDSFAVMSGDSPPTITGGYAKWQNVDRPLRRGLTIFQGYDPVTMTLSVRFGVWDGYCGFVKVPNEGSGWATDEAAGKYVEYDIERLEWMAGSNFPAGAPPFVYVNTYGPKGGSTNLIPYEYQNTAGVGGSWNDTSTWPWVITSLSWGKSWRARNADGTQTGSRIYQEAQITLTNFQGLSKPPTKQESGHYFTSRKSFNTMLLIAAAQTPKPLDVQTLANSIKSDKKNNPIKGSKIHLKEHMLRWTIPDGKPIWVPKYYYGA